MKTTRLFTLVAAVALMTAGCSKDDKPLATQDQPIHDQPTPQANMENGHEYVDLGVGVKWATCNIGAATPNDYGDYFTWNGITPLYSSITNSRLIIKEGFASEGYHLKNVPHYVWRDQPIENGQITKYSSSHPLEAEDDAASVNWGGRWHMPSVADFHQLLDSTKFEWRYIRQGNADHNGVPGWEVISRIDGCVGNRVFFPLAGSIVNTTITNRNSYGYYWTTELSTAEQAELYHNNHLARCLILRTEASHANPAMSVSGYNVGLPIRPVF